MAKRLYLPPLPEDRRTIPDQGASDCVDLPQVSPSIGSDVRDRDGTQSYAFLITHLAQPPVVWYK